MRFVLRVSCTAIILMTIVIGESAMQYSKVEICGVDTSKLRVLKEKESLSFSRKSGKVISLRVKN